MTAEPKQCQRNKQCRRDRAKRQPRNLPFVGKPASSFWFAAHYSCNQRSAISNRQCLKAILLQTTVESASAQAQRLCGLARVPVISGQRFFDQKCLDFFETHFLDVPRFAAASRQTKVGCANLSILGHQHGALNDVIEFSNVSGKAML